MAPCTPSDNTLNPIVPPPTPVPGFGIPFSPVQIPIEGLGLPTELLEDVMGLAQRISAQFPSGIFKANPDFSMKNVLDFVANILSQIAPFMSFYNFIMACLRIIVCVIEVLCAIPNPFAVAQKLKVLFTECLPPFLNLFPFSALVVMIVSLLLLILAIIEYIITVVISIVEQIISNLEVLASGVTLSDAQSTLAAAQKIASLLCFIQNILAIFVALAAIMAIVETLAKLAGFGICADNDEDGCCTPDICPAFIKNTPDGITVEVGTLKYISQIGVDLTGSLPPALASIIQIPPLREGRWQLYDTAQDPQYPIALIITPVLDNIFWPEEVQEFPADVSLRRAPYTADITLTVNPADFGHVDSFGERVFQIKNCVVVRKPYRGVYLYDNTLFDTPSTGTLNVEGGLVYEEDGTTPYMISGEQATLNDFIVVASSNATTLPVSDDSITISNVRFVWKPNAPALAGYQLTTVGCIPEVNVEKAVQNAILAAEGLDPVIDRLPPTPAGVSLPSTGNFLPNIDGATQCVTNALNTFRTDVSAVKAAEFQATVETCLGDLRNQTLSTLCAALIAAVSQYKSSVTLDTDVQFTTRPIQVSVTLKDPTGSNLGLGIPQSCGDQMAALLTGEASFGQISEFSYDAASSLFLASLTADEAGDGVLTLTFNEKVLSTVTPGEVGGAATSIEETEVAYQFVDATVEPPVRRDASDVAQGVGG